MFRSRRWIGFALVVMTCIWSAPIGGAQTNGAPDLAHFDTVSIDVSTACDLTTGERVISWVLTNDEGTGIGVTIYPPTVTVGAISVSSASFAPPEIVALGEQSFLETRVDPDFAGPVRIEFDVGPSDLSEPTIHGNRVVLVTACTSGGFQLACPTSDAEEELAIEFTFENTTGYALSAMSGTYALAADTPQAFDIDPTELAVGESTTGRIALPRMASGVLTVQLQFNPGSSHTTYAFEVTPCPRSEATTVPATSTTTTVVTTTTSCKCPYRDGLVAKELATTGRFLPELITMGALCLLAGVALRRRAHRSLSGPRLRG